MSDQFRLTEAQLKRIVPYFPKSRGVPRVDDCRVVSGIIHVIRNGLRWRRRPRSMAPIRRSTTGSFSGPARAFSTTSSPTLRLRAGRPTGR
jgi:transposase